MKTIALLLTLLAVPAFADEKEELTKKMEAWAADFSARKTDALVKYYADDVEFVYAFEGQEGKGKKALQAFYTQAFAGPPVSVKLKSYDVVKVSDTLMFGLGVWEDTLTMPDGKTQVVAVHSSEVFVKKGKTWLVRVDHASFVPPPQPPPQAPPKK
jgi:uncharacterized protein (TIGR02246 family)